MKVYLVREYFEGCLDGVWSTAEKANEYGLLVCGEGNFEVIEVTVDRV